MSASTNNVIRAVLPRLLRSPELTKRWVFAAVGSSKDNDSNTKMDWSPRALLTTKRRRDGIHNNAKNTNNKDDDDKSKDITDIGLLDFLSSSSSPSSSSFTNNENNYYFQQSSLLTIKTSKHNRFFMYEEEKSKLQYNSDSNTIIQQCTPLQLSDLLHNDYYKNEENNDGNNCDSSHRPKNHNYCYWTGTIQDFAPNLLNDNKNEALIDHDLLYKYFFDDIPSSLDSSSRKSPPSHDSIYPAIQLDPRGPSIWMGSSGSSTQAHYDIADNIIVQLYGTKRVRIYKPSIGLQKLHLYPDTHSKARKSQIDFDEFVDNNNNSNFDNDDCWNDGKEQQTQTHKLFPHVNNISQPELDIILSPGDVLRIPAFWIHHVENGKIPSSSSLSSSKGLAAAAAAAAAVVTKQETEMLDGPSVSINLFAISEPMKLARTIFKEGSRPFHNYHCYDDNDDDNYQFAIVALSTLGHELINRISSLVKQQQQQRQNQSPWSSHFSLSSQDFIWTYLLEARYNPLKQQCKNNNDNNNNNNSKSVEQINVDDNNKINNYVKQQERNLTLKEKKMVNDCINRLMSYFGILLRHGCNNNKSNCCNSEKYDEGDGEGIVSLVVCHLLELWAVEMVGEENVEKVWKDAIYYKKKERK